MKKNIFQRTIEALTLATALGSCATVPVKEVLVNDVNKPKWIGGGSYCLDGRYAYLNYFSNGSIRVGYTEKNQGTEYVLEDQGTYTDLLSLTATMTGRGEIRKRKDGSVEVFARAVPTPTTPNIVPGEENLFFRACARADANNDGAVSSKEAEVAFRDSLENYF